MAEEFDVCWSTVIAATDTHAAFGDAPDNGWVQRCRLGSGHPGIHASDAGAGPRDGFRLWLQWSDEDDTHRLTELEPCPVLDSTDLACVFFAGHGGPHRYIPTTSTPRFGTHYRPDTTVSVNGVNRSGSVVTADDAAPTTSEAPESPSVPEPEPEAPAALPLPEPDAPSPRHESPDPAPEADEVRVGTGRRSRHSGEPADEVARWMAGHAAGRVRSVDEVLLDLVDLLSELATSIKQQHES